VDHDSHHHRAHRGAGDVRRMGVVTGKGLSDLIREEFGLRITFILMVLLVVVNYTNVVTEFIGIAGSLHLFHVSKFISVPSLRHPGLVYGGARHYKSTEKIFLVASLVYIAYIFAGVLSQPDWHDALWATVKCLPDRYGAIRPICTWPSASWAPPSPHGCSSTCSPRSWKREFA
jgi:hypothetical protein